MAAISYFDRKRREPPPGRLFFGYREKRYSTTVAEERCRLISRISETMPQPIRA
jgi:hypothetical protein